MLRPPNGAPRQTALLRVDVVSLIRTLSGLHFKHAKFRSASRLTIFRQMQPWSHLRFDVLENPGAGEGPLALNRALSYAQMLRDFVVGHSPEKLHYYNARLLRVFNLQFFQRLVEQQDFVVWTGGGKVNAVD